MALKCVVCLQTAAVTRLILMHSAQQEDALNYEQLTNIKISSQYDSFVCTRCSFDMTSAVKIMKMAKESAEQLNFKSDTTPPIKEFKHPVNTTAKSYKMVARTMTANDIEKLIGGKDIHVSVKPGNGTKAQNSNGSGRAVIQKVEPLRQPIKPNNHLATVKQEFPSKRAHSEMIVEVDSENDEAKVPGKIVQPQKKVIIKKIQPTAKKMDPQNVQYQNLNKRSYGPASMKRVNPKVMSKNVKYFVKENGRHSVMEFNNEEEAEQTMSSMPQATFELLEDTGYVVKTS